MKRVLKWIGIVAGGLLGLIILLVVGVYAVSASRLNKTYEVTAVFNLNVPNDPESIAAGESCLPSTVRAVMGQIWPEISFLMIPPLGKSTAPI